MVQILVAGIPRSGTTMTLRLLNEHGEVFGWPGETSVLDLTRTLWAGGKPNEACRAQVQEFVEQALVAALIEMQSWNAKTFDLQSTAIPTLREVTTLSRNVVDAALGSESVGEALASASASLKVFLRRFTDCALVAEKTPSNLFAFPHFSDDAARDWIFCHREPFAVVSSIRNRAGKDPFSADWGESLDAAIGVYIKYAEQIVRAIDGDPNEGDHARFVLAAYEDVCADPSNLLSRLGIGAKVDARRINKMIGPVSDREVWKQFTPFERWKVLCLTEPFRSRLGYGEEYYGLSEAQMIGDMPEPLEFGASALFGAFDRSEVNVFRWLSDSSAFALYVPPQISAVTAALFNPSELGLDVQRITVSDGERTIASVELPSDKHVALYIDLTRAKPVGMTEHGRLYKIEMRAQQALLPVAQLPGNHDRRLLSCLMSPWTGKMNVTHLV